MNDFKSSKYKRAIFDAIRNSDKNISIQAVAGSGKTTTILQSLHLIPPHKSIAFLAFNNHIVQELREKAPSYVDVTTIHSLGLKSLKQYYQYIDVVPNKIFSICEDLLDHKINRRIKYYYYNNIKKLVDLYKQNLSTSIDDFEDLAFKHNIDLIGDEVDDANMVFLMSLEDKARFDFTDMIYIPAVLGDIYLPKYDFVFVDESQDLNRAQQEIIKKIKKRKGRLISVGDPNQAIYGFAGSDAESFNRLANYENTIKLPLSVCYRCSKEVVKMAKQVVSHIEPFKGNEVGMAGEGDMEEIKDGDWVLCRNVKPLIVLCINLIDRGYKAKIKGVDIAKGIISLLKSLGNVKSNDIALIKIKEKIEKEKEKLLKAGFERPDSHPRIIKIKEQRTVIKFLSKRQPDVYHIICKLEEIFSDKETEGVLLSTIHKSKGLENDRVFLICPNLIPSRYATKEWQLEQEQNLLYVAYTRAKRELIIVNDKDYKNFIEVV